ncbi:ribbon-helix-helix protein, CopG family [Streptacidiphilus sp. P02-A3a]|uniref:ribbon-helix-helix protein, CopG family n=1 Tax=Streptacidiphilus sp. P02-A3a TaxID=2704468 RepID=UPI0015FD5BAF|nr:ribbon-helix-helix protein, CopG family [Streptacidiphilus sp. P02-A3a]QMU68266.1 ribbon-helix-helix protein, CopG family [Streptacidiphilus sp. P02-A3a]
MAVTLRLPETDDQLLTERAKAEGRSKQELATEAIHVFLTRRTELFADVLDQVMTEDAELLERLA